jgi:hypothetical protein
VNCSVSIGSQMHDTCCGFYPGGVMCGGSTAQYCTRLQPQPVRQRWRLGHALRRRVQPGPG